jgi:hypothetical protein
MRVRVSVTVDIDPQTWALEYGVPLQDVRGDVKQYVQQLVMDQLESVGVTK